jgi:hypothetical protein
MYVPKYVATVGATNRTIHTYRIHKQDGQNRNYYSFMFFRFKSDHIVIKTNLIIFIYIIEKNKLMLSIFTIFMFKVGSYVPYHWY